MPSFPKAKSRPIAAKEVIPELLATRSQNINPWINALKSGAATICKTEGNYRGLIIKADLKEAEIRTSWQSYRVLTGKEKKKYFGLQRLDLNKITPTITKDAGNTTTGLIHPFEIRKLTIPEIKKLSSYPDAFILTGNFHEKWAIIGNSVPPLFMKEIALHIKNEILERFQQHTGLEPILL